MTKSSLSKPARAAAPDPGVRRGCIPGGIALRVDAAPWFDDCEITYLGTQAALQAAGCLTPEMLSIRAARRRGDTRRMHDERGVKFTFHRAGTKAAPDRMELSLLTCEAAIVEKLPGVRELIPEGLARYLANEGALKPRGGPPVLRLVVDNTPGRP
jgi:hypothetical protein